MKLVLNTEQSKALSNFFLDLAKGIILGVFGFSATASEVGFVTKAVSIIAAAAFAWLFVRLGLILLEE